MHWNAGQFKSIYPNDLGGGGGGVLLKQYTQTYNLERKKFTI